MHSLLLLVLLLLVASVAVLASLLGAGRVKWSSVLHWRRAQHDWHIPKLDLPGRLLLASNGSSSSGAQSYLLGGCMPGPVATEVAICDRTAPAVSCQVLLRGR